MDSKNPADICHVTPIFFRTVHSSFIISEYPPDIFSRQPSINTHSCYGCSCWHLIHIQTDRRTSHLPCVVNKVRQTIPPLTIVILMAPFHVFKCLWHFSQSHAYHDLCASLASSPNKCVQWQELCNDCLSGCPSVSPHGAALFTRKRSSWNFILDNFTNTRDKIQSR